MTQLLALSFDCATTPSIRLKAIEQIGESLDTTYGWGFGWYPTSGDAAMVIKDPTAVGENALSAVLSNWERFSSTLFLAHLRGAAKRRMQKDTHPFMRTWGGRDWLFTHNGDLRHEFRSELPLPEQRVFEPLGSTDSEHVFCWLLEQMRAVGARRIREVDSALLHSWLRQINALGTANLLFTDGLDLIAYSDAFGYRPLWWTRRTPPDSTLHFENEEVDMVLGSKTDQNRTFVVVSTSPLSSSGWETIGDGAMLRVSRGGVMEHVFAEQPEQFVQRPIGQQQSLQGSSTPQADTPTPTEQANYATTNDGGTVDTQQQPVTPSTGDPVDVASNTLNAPEIRHAALARREHSDQLAKDAQSRVLETVHETVYRYDTPVEKSLHFFRLRPVHDLTQELLDYQLDIEPLGPYRHFEDVFGNYTTETEFSQPYNELKITCRSRVRLNAHLRPKLRSVRQPQRLPLVWMPWQRQMMLPYLLPLELPETQLRELSEYAMSFVERQDHDLVDTLKDINRTIYRDYAYTPDSTTLQTTPFEVYTRRRGVCQDFANLFIAMARLLGIPARYRVGYIFTGSNYANARQGDESHAWVELYLPRVGWRGFDPTNGTLVGSDHIRVACGRNYSDASPTSGTIYRGGQGETLSVRVEVRELMSPQEE
jgi:transglutaminase-like putative cysteine protease/predicted glutamine amidotransferase